jgi:hypothetical protein
MKNSIVLTCIWTVFLACGSAKSNTEKWIGDTKINLIRDKGMPIRTIQYEGNVEILIYASQIIEHSKSSSRIEKSYWSYNYFYTNTEGKIVNVRNDQHNYPPQAIDDQKVANMNHGVKN